MDNIIKTKNNNQSGVVKVSHEAASYYADLAKKWAVKTDFKVDGSEYSAKYYADKAKSEAESIAETIESANELINGIETTKTEINELKENSITNIQEEKSSAISSIDEAKTTAVNAVEEVKAQATTDLEAEKANAIKAVQGVSSIKIATTEQAGLVKPDGETITVAEDGTISAVGGNISSGTLSVDFYSSYVITDERFETLVARNKANDKNKYTNSSILVSCFWKFYSNGWVDITGRSFIPYLEQTFNFIPILEGLTAQYKLKTNKSPNATMTIDFGHDYVKENFLECAKIEASTKSDIHFSTITNDTFSGGRLFVVQYLNADFFLNWHCVGEYQKI